MAKKKILSGMRSTGLLHLGNYHGALKNWVSLQNDYDCFFFIADWHGLTTEYADPKLLKDYTFNVALDFLAYGLDPKKSTLFIQSHVKEHAELYLLLSMITPLGWLERVPSYKEMQQELADKDIRTYGFLGYPVLQSADILIYNADCVPVGVDQAPHVELTREIARRFNHLYGETFVEPKVLLTEAPKLLGLDRRKMSKSYNNAIYLSDPPETVEKKIMSAITDPARKRREDPGNPDVCLVYDLHKLHSKPQDVKTIDGQCRKAEIGCVDCKKMLVKELHSFMKPCLERREELKQQPKKVLQILEEGCQKARETASQVVEKVRKRMFLS